MLSTVESWSSELEALHARIAPMFPRSESRARALRYLRALLSPVDRKNGWQLAEAMGEARPKGTQEFLAEPGWDPDAVQGALRAYVVESLGSPSGVLVVDETGFLKKGTRSAGVKRQYSGTAGRVENCQVGVFLAYASEKGAALVDRALYLPAEWAEDADRRKDAGVPEGVSFRTKPELAQAMLERALDAGLPCAWATGDAVYGAARSLRMELERRRRPFVLGVSSGERLMVEWGGYARADALLERAEEGGWTRLSAGEGTKGPRLYDWALAPLWRLQLTDEERAWGHALLVRRSLDDPSDLAYYVVFAPREGTSLEALARVAGTRWRVESCFEEAKQECGLDEYEVRRWLGWHRHVTLSMLAHAFLAATRARQRESEEKKGDLASAASSP
jgi:SRSO17 transposase